MNSRKQSYLVQKLIALLLTIGIFSTLYYYSTLRTAEKPHLQPKIEWMLVSMDKRIALTPAVSSIFSQSIKNYNSKKPVYVNFWAHWCLPCLEELPLINELQADFKDITFLLQNIDEDPDSLNSAKEFSQQFQELNFDFENGVALKKEFNMSAVPMHLFLDKKQQIAGFFIGDMLNKKEKVKELLLQLQSEVLEAN